MRLVVILLLLAGCAAKHVEKARAALVGKDVTVAEQCLGIPSKTDHVEGLTITQWDYQEAASSASLPLADLALLPIALPLSLTNAGALSLGTAHSCHVIASSETGRITGIILSGDNGGLSGAGAACEPVFRGCIGP